MRASLFAVVVPLMAITCRQVLDIEDLREAHTPNEPAPHPCEPTTHTCVAAAPASWIGPVALFIGEGTAPACTGELAETVKTYHDGLIVGEASCQCACADAEGIACDAARVCYWGDRIQCSTACHDFEIDATFPPTVCTYIAGALFARVLIPPPTDVGSCAHVPSHVLPEVAWSTTARACEGPNTPEGCAEGEVCSPNADEPFKTCVRLDGDLACPDGLYRERHVLYEDFLDERVCSRCECGPPNSTCGGAVNFTKGDCTSLVNSIESDHCEDMADATEAEYIPAPAGTCQPSGGQLSGTVTRKVPMTFCCLQP